MNLPHYVKKILAELSDGGYEAYAVGGCVRDCIMGREPHDFDIAASALPEQVQRLFARTVPTGIRYGTVTVVTEEGSAEVTAFRKDGRYADGRHPVLVELSAGIEDDLARRDFTVNAMAADINGNIIDPFGGRADISAKLIRCVGRPERRFEEDALRIMRAFRFASALDFDIEEKTFAAALRLSPGLAKISAERISAELVKTLAGVRPSALAPLIDAGGLEFTGIKSAGDLSLLDGVSCMVDLPSAAAALCSVCGCSVTELCTALRLPSKVKRQAETVSGIISNIPESRADIKRAMRSAGEDARDAFFVSSIINGRDSEYYNNRMSDILARGEAYRTDMLSVRGGDLLGVGVAAENIGAVLNILLERVTEDPSINTKERLLAAAKNITPDEISEGKGRQRGRRTP